MTPMTFCGAKAITNGSRESGSTILTLTEQAAHFQVPSPQILPKAIVSLIQWQGLRNIFHMRLHQCSILDKAQDRLTMAVSLGPVLCGIREGSFKSLPGEFYNRHKGRKLQLQIIIIEIGEKLK